MSKSILSFTIGVFVFLTSCSTAVEKKEKSTDISQLEISKADKIVEEAIQAHGGNHYETAHVQFTFRGKTYRFKNEGKKYEYEYRGWNKSGDSIRTLLTTEGVKVWQNNLPIDLNEKQQLSYSDNLNSVIYFATLPHKLADHSVNKTYAGTTTIFNKAYEVIKVTFDQEGGGTDFDDQYYYWINAVTKEIDYLAYNYHTNGGGVRFRSAYNKRRIGEILFQDYVNYKAEVGTPLVELATQFEKGELEEISRIETEKISLVTN